MNSFFASVEQQANPSLRGKPVGICASLHPTSCLIAASKEAKAIGIKTGTLIAQAKQICPEIVLVQAEPEKYRAVNEGFNRIYLEYTPLVERYSIDESFLDLRPTKLNPVSVAVEIKRRIKEEVGEWLTCSIGIGSNKFLAKLGSEIKKPDGLALVFREHLREIYRGRKFSDLWGLSRGWTKRLSQLGILTPTQLLDYPVQNLISSFGKPGFYIWQRVQGLEEDEIIPSENEAVQKSFGHSWVLNFRTTDKKRLEKVILRLSEKAARRMRREGLLAYGFYFALRQADGASFHQSRRLKYPIKQGLELFKLAKLMWQPWNIQKNVTWMAVGFTGLKRSSAQIPLFPKKEDGLLAVLDKINDKYGEFSIRSGLLIDTQGFVPDAIAFGK
ncbi:MAG: DNA polymerase Y family protein [Acidobacteriaceae bacterium]